MVRIVCWLFESIGFALSLYSVVIVAWFLGAVFHDFGRAGGHTPGGAPGNLGSGVGIAIVLGSGLLAAVFAYGFSVIGLPAQEDKASRLWKLSRFTRKLALIGICVPFGLAAIDLLLA